MPDTLLRPPAVILADAQATPAPLSAVRLDEDEVRLARTVGRGCSCALMDTPVRFHAEPAQDRGDWAGALVLAGPGGPIALQDGARLLRGLTGIDPGQAASQPWLAASLAGRLAATPLAGFAIGTGAASGSHCLRLSLRSRTHQVSTLARATVPAWLDFLARSAWQPERTPALPWLAVSSRATVLLARHTLAAGALRSLAPGDVILPDNPLFRPDGSGRIQLGGRAVGVRYLPPNSLELFDVEHNVTTDDEQYAAAQNDQDDQDDQHDQDDGSGEAAEASEAAEAIFTDIDAAPEAAAPRHEELDGLPVTLHFELGQVCLPLGELRTLGPGAVVLFEGGSPASVAIVSGGQTVGRGEIVDVAGQLGIRLTRWSAPC